MGDNNLNTEIGHFSFTIAEEGNYEAVL